MIVACDDDGRPDFYALHFHRDRDLCIWAFDLLHYNGTRPARAASIQAQGEAQEADPRRKHQLGALFGKL
jgi:hypothetical protein